MALNIAALQSGIPSAFEQAVGGFQTGLQARQIQQEMQAKQQERQVFAAQQARLKEVLGGLASNPNPTAADYAKAIAEFPQMKEGLSASFEMMDTEQRKNRQTEAVNLYSMLSTGNTELAKEMMQERLTAAENSGNPREAAGAKAMLQLIENNPDAAKTSAGLLLANSMGEDEFASVLGRLGSEERETTGMKFEIAKTAASIGLTEAQTKAAIAGLEKTSLETQKAALELKALQDGNEPIPVEKKFDMEKALRADYFKQAANFYEVQEAYRRVKAVKDTAAGDLALIFNYMKMLDPGSTVREGEFATAQNATGVPQRVLNLYNNIRTGERLAPNQRAEFKSQTDSLFDAAKTREQEVRKQLSPAIKNYKLNADNVFGEVAEQTEGGDVPEGVDPEDWKYLTDEQKKLWLSQ